MKILTKHTSFLPLTIRFVFVTLVLLGCESSKLTKPDNEPPAIPFNPVPADSAFNEAIDLQLSWTCLDPDANKLVYDIFFGLSELPPLVVSNLDTTMYVPGILENSTTYYWKVIAKDGTTATAGPVWHFRTSGIQPGAERLFPLGNTGVMIEMVWIPAGSFLMGSQRGELDMEFDEMPAHTVNINYGFWMGRFEITQLQWESIMGNNPATGCGVGDNYPVYNVSWNDVQEFLSHLDAKYRLPSEAEWEYACRAGTTERYYWGDDPEYTVIDEYALFRGNSSGSTKPVGQKLPNTWGLFDMGGNVFEWCADWYCYGYEGAPDDGSARLEPEGFTRALRGGAWDRPPAACRSANRVGNVPDVRYNYYGFRLVRDN